jgi:hypothetical protein
MHEFETRLAEERKLADDAAKKKAQADVDIELRSMKEQLSEQQSRIKNLSDRELELLRKERAQAEQMEQMKLTIERQLNEERSRIREQAEVQLREEHRLQDAEQKKLIDGLQKKIDDLQRASKQGSEQSQGETLELQLEGDLQRAFVYDSIQPVPKGIRGADVIQTVRDATRDCGIILWESKRTKGWSKEWIPKLKEDQRNLRADMAVLLSTALPEGIRNFAQVEGVWVCDITNAIALAGVLREGLIAVAKQRAANEGKSEKMELLYHYLSGQEFAQHVQSMMEVFINMRKELDDERRAYEKIWAKREKQIGRMERSAARLRGDLEGIMGNALPAVEMLGLPDVSEE